MGILGVIAAVAICPGVAVAADFKVDTTADGDDKECLADCTLREAVSLAGSSDQVILPSGNYVLADGELVLNNDTIVGEDARTTFIDGADKSRVLRVIEVTSRVSGVTIRNGNGVGLDPDGLGGGIYIHSGTLLLQNSTVSGNTGTQGAGIAANGIAQLIGVTVSGNRATSGRLTRGGGIATSTTGGVFLGNSTVSGNSAVDDVGAASQGGGIHSSGALLVINSTIAANTAGEGGGLYVVAPPTGSPNSDDSIFAAGSGGACGGPGVPAMTGDGNIASDDTCSFKGSGNRYSTNPQIAGLTNNGGPTNTHALLPASPAINTARACTAIDQRGVARPQPTAGLCDVGAFEYRAPTLKVVTNVVNDSGGTRTASAFTVHVRLGATDVQGSPQPGTSEGSTYTLSAGQTYSVAVDAPAGYSVAIGGDCAPNGNVGLIEGQNKTCTVTANDVAPTLTVVTNVVNDNGGTRTPANFTAHVRSGPNDVTGSPQPGTSSGTPYTLSAGSYTVSADAVTGYTLAVSGACAANGNVTLQLAQTATCTITANDIAPTLTVVTNVVNDNGGTLTPAGVTTHVRLGANDVANSPRAGTAAGFTYTLSAGSTYVVSAENVTGYALALSGSCSVTLTVGQAATCTITANDVAPTLTVVTSVVNDNGGTLTPAGVTTHVRLGANDVANSPRAGTAAGFTYTLSAGSTYVVSAENVTGYALGLSGSCTVTLTVGQVASCTITANDIAPRLTVVTNVVNDAGGALAPVDFDVHVRRAGTDIAGSPKKGSAAGVAYTVAAGAHDVAADDRAGYSQSRSPACTATYALDQSYTCTITLEDGAPQLTVITKVVNDDGGGAAPEDFDVSVRLDGEDVANSPKAGSAAGTAYSLAADTYTVGAGGVPGYAIATSGDCAAGGSVTLAVGDGPRTCTVTADDMAATLTVVTSVVNDNGGTRCRPAFSVHVRRGGADVGGSPQPGSSSGTTYTLDAGPHTVAADPVAGYGLAVGGACASDGSVSLSNGDSRTCTVTANDEPVVISDSPPLPPPVPKKLVNALPASGTVKVKLPGSDKYVTLATGEQIPVGTLIDVRKGRITLVAAADTSGGTATADFYGGIARLGQTGKNKLTTTLTLTEKLTCPKAGKAVAAATKRKRRLWGDGSGRFQTRGKHSAATVVGTKWLVEDSCTSTLTRVVRGKVSVRDFVKKKTVTVRAGKKYVARARKR